MRKPSQKDQLTDKEEELMRLLWEHGPAFISQLVDLYPEPKPHFNTVATVMRRLETKGFAAHTDVAGSFQYYPLAELDTFRKRSLGRVIKNYFKGSYYSAVSALVADEKISADELRELLQIIENKNSR